MLRTPGRSPLLQRSRWQSLQPRLLMRALPRHQDQTPSSRTAPRSLLRDAAVQSLRPAACVLQLRQRSCRQRVAWPKPQPGLQMSRASALLHWLHWRSMAARSATLVAASWNWKGSSSCWVPQRRCRTRWCQRLSLPRPVWQTTRNPQQPGATRRSPRPTVRSLQRPSAHRLALYVSRQATRTTSAASTGCCPTLFALGQPTHAAVPALGRQSSSSGRPRGAGAHGSLPASRPQPRTTRGPRRSRPPGRPKVQRCLGSLPEAFRLPGQRCRTSCTASAGTRAAASWTSCSSTPRAPEAAAWLLVLPPTSHGPGMGHGAGRGP
mmetsp:Transcript_42879/g.122279  ORF Transcript_42879/g.122279 Transcript_42879/m.122279 type:complete len:322 (-) Transcript_42879:54-1019(-)